MLQTPICHPSDRQDLLSLATMLIEGSGLQIQDGLYVYGVHDHPGNCDPIRKP